jgi:hypothetical protein
MANLSIFRIYRDPLEAEELIEILDKHGIHFDRTFDKPIEAENYIGSNPFDMEIVIRISKEHFSKVEALLNASI